MDSIIFFQFDKIITIQKPRPCTTALEACYGTLPRASLNPGAAQLLSLCRRLGFQCVLLADGEERFIKEALLTAGACRFFDKIYISGETGLEVPRPAISLLPQFSSGEALS